MIPPDTRDIATCKRCGSTIRFVYLVNGRRVPCDPEPTPKGRLRADFDPAGGVYTGARFLLQRESAPTRFTPHSDSCGRHRSLRGVPIPEDLRQQMRADIAAAKALYESDGNGLA